MYLHGGGFVRGDLGSYDDIAWGLAEGTGAVVLSVDYRLAPEHPYPAAFDDCYGVLCWLGSQEARALGLNPDRLALAGDSAGGQLIATLCLAARDHKVRGSPLRR
jgi:acetyl esterase